MPRNLSPFSFQFSPPLARHYHSALSLWLSVDPLSDKYPGVSPYVYCGNNPIVLKDPDGREIGDYYDWHGNYLGWDGVVDDKVYIVSGQIPKRNIDKTTRIVKSLGNATIDLTISKSVISEAINVYDRTVLNGGDDEECSAFDCDGNLFVGERGEGGMSNLPITDGAVSIHSHRLTTGKNAKNQTTYRSPEHLSLNCVSGCDESTFKNFDLNIVVGQSMPDEFEFRTPIMFFYGPYVSKNDSKSIGTMKITEAKKIFQH